MSKNRFVSSAICVLVVLAAIFLRANLLCANLMFAKFLADNFLALVYFFKNSENADYLNNNQNIYQIFCRQPTFHQLRSAL